MGFFKLVYMGICIFELNDWLKQFWLSKKLHKSNLSVHQTIHDKLYSNIIIKQLTFVKNQNFQNFAHM